MRIALISSTRLTTTTRLHNKAETPAMGSTRNACTDEAIRNNKGVFMFRYKEYVLHFSFAKYRTGGLAVLLTDNDGPFTTLSVNVEGVELQEGCFLLKAWSENEEIAKFLIDNGYIELTGRGVECGYSMAYEARLTDKAKPSLQ